MAHISQLLPGFCSLFKEVCDSEGQKPSPKRHICSKHWLDVFEENCFTRDESEEAIEGMHYMIDRYTQQSAHFIGHEK